VTKNNIFTGVLCLILPVTRVANNISQTAQNRYKIPGVPSWAMNKNWPVVIAISEVKTAILGLNQRTNSMVSPIADKKAKIIDGSFMLKIDNPKSDKLACCSRWYGKLVTAKLFMSNGLIELLFITDCISSVDIPPGKYRPANSNTIINPIATSVQPMMYRWR
jgi:hypothetical protein